MNFKEFSSMVGLPHLAQEFDGGMELSTVTFRSTIESVTLEFDGSKLVAIKEGSNFWKASDGDIRVILGWELENEEE